MKNLTLEIGREAAILIAGALLAAFIMSHFPEARAWMRKQWA